MMPSKLILGMRLAGRQVAVVVIHQAESLRRVGVLWERDKLRIASFVTPALSPGAFDGVDLYVRGRNEGADRNICVWEFETEEEACCIYHLIREGVAAINAEPVGESIETSAGFEIVK